MRCKGFEMVNIAKMVDITQMGYVRVHSVQIGEKSKGSAGIRDVWGNTSIVVEGWIRASEPVVRCSKGHKW